MKWGKISFGDIVLGKKSRFFCFTHHLFLEFLHGINCGIYDPDGAVFRNKGYAVSGTRANTPNGRCLGGAV